MEQVNTNLFQKAIQNNQLLDFALGNNEYFLHDREGYGEHWTLGIWLYHIIPCLEKNQGVQEIKDMFDLLLDSYPISNTKIYDNLLYNTHAYVSVLRSKRLKISILSNHKINQIINRLEDYLNHLKSIRVSSYDETESLLNSLKNRFLEINTNSQQ